MSRTNTNSSEAKNINKITTAAMSRAFEEGKANLLLLNANASNGNLGKRNLTGAVAGKSTKRSLKKVDDVKLDKFPNLVNQQNNHGLDWKVNNLGGGGGGGLLMLEEGWSLKEEEEGGRGQQHEEDDELTINGHHHHQSLSQSSSHPSLSDSQPLQGLSQASSIDTAFSIPHDTPPHLPPSSAQAEEGLALMDFTLHPNISSSSSSSLQNHPDSTARNFDNSLPASLATSKPPAKNHLQLEPIFNEGNLPLYDENYLLEGKLGGGVGIGGGSFSSGSGEGPVFATPVIVNDRGAADDLEGEEGGTSTSISKARGKGKKAILQGVTVASVEKVKKVKTDKKGRSSLSKKSRSNLEAGLALDLAAAASSASQNSKSASGSTSSNIPAGALPTTATPTERRLHSLKSLIIEESATVASFVTIGKALTTLYYTEKLMKSQKEFLEWTRKNLGFSKSTTYEYVVSYRVYGDICRGLQEGYEPPQYQSHCQLLAKVPSDEVSDVWKAVCDACTEGHVTTAILEQYLIAYKNNGNKSFSTPIAPSFSSATRAAPPTEVDPPPEKKRIVAKPKGKGGSVSKKRKHVSDDEEDELEDDDEKTNNSLLKSDPERDYVYYKKAVLLPATDGAPLSATAGPLTVEIAPIVGLEGAKGNIGDTLPLNGKEEGKEVKVQPRPNTPEGFHSFSGSLLMEPQFPTRSTTQEVEEHLVTPSILRRKPSPPSLPAAPATAKLVSPPRLSARVLSASHAQQQAQQLPTTPKRMAQQLLRSKQTHRESLPFDIQKVFELAKKVISFSADIQEDSKLKGFDKEAHTLEEFEGIEKQVWGGSVFADLSESLPYSASPLNKSANGGEASGGGRSRARTRTTSSSSLNNAGSPYPKSKLQPYSQPPSRPQQQQQALARGIELNLQTIFTRYALKEYTEGLFLLKGEFGKDWFVPVTQHPHCVLRHTKKDGGNNGSYVVFYMGPSIKEFCEIFGKVGFIPGFNSWSFSQTAAVTSPGRTFLSRVDQYHYLHQQSGSEGSSVPLFPQHLPFNQEGAVPHHNFQLHEHQPAPTVHQFKPHSAMENRNADFSCLPSFDSSRMNRGDSQAYGDSGGQLLEQEGGDSGGMGLDGEEDTTVQREPTKMRRVGRSSQAGQAGPISVKEERGESQGEEDLSAVANLLLGL